MLISRYKRMKLFAFTCAISKVNKCMKIILLSTNYSIRVEIKLELNPAIQKHQNTRYYFAKKIIVIKKG